MTTRERAVAATERYMARMTGAAMALEGATSMSGYENAPATKILATHCAICARPLVDAKSVELGIGPDCRKKHGFDVDVDDAARAEANRLVHAVAAARNEETAAFAAALKAAAEKLPALGFAKLAARIVERAARVQIEEIGTGLLVVTPFVEDAVPAWRTIPGRRWDRERKANTVPASSRPELWAFLKHYFGGEIAVGPKGVFTI